VPPPEARAQRPPPRHACGAANHCSILARNWIFPRSEVLGRCAAASCNDAAATSRRQCCKRGLKSLRAASNALHHIAITWLPASSALSARGRCATPDECTTARMPSHGAVVQTSCSQPDPARCVLIQPDRPSTLAPRPPHVLPSGRYAVQLAVPPRVSPGRGGSGCRISEVFAITTPIRVSISTSEPTAPRWISTR